MNANLEAATRALETAAAFAEDGGIATAIERASEAIRILKAEQRRRAAVLREIARAQKARSR